jgi:multiple sugar transport system permease protein
MPPADISGWPESQPASAPHHRGGGRRRGAVQQLVFMAPAAILLGVLSLYPIYLMVRMALSDVTAANILGAWPLIGLGNLIETVQNPTFQAVTLQTLVFLLGVLVFTLTVGFVWAMMLRLPTRVNYLAQTLMVFVWALPPVVVGNVWSFLLSSSGPVNAALVAGHVVPSPIPFLSQPQTSLLSIAVVTIWAGVPFAVLVIKSAILDIPTEVLEAARVDGAKPIQTAWHIVLPSIRPTLYILGVLSVVGAFKGFDFIYVMSAGGPGTSSSTIPFLAYRTAFKDYEFGTAGAMSVLAMLVVLALATAYIVVVRREDR